jgi:tetratricopeptide (TPR) repeat protein
MKILKYSFLAIFAAALLGSLTTNATAQEQRRAAVQAFNEARDLAKNKEYDQAISKFQETIELGETASAEGEADDSKDIVELAQDKLPDIFYAKALDAYRAFQNSRSISNLESSITAFSDAADAGGEYGKSSVADKSNSNITQLMYMKSVLQYSEQSYDEALASADAVIERNPNYEKAYYQKGLILKKKDGNFDTALAAFDEAIAMAEKNGNNEIASKAKENASGELVYRGAKQIEGKNYTSGIEMVKRGLEYNPESSDAHYRLAQAYNKRGSWDQGLTHAQKALDLESGGRTEKAKIYFEIASAYKGKGNFPEACSSFSDAAYGQFQSPSEHQMEYELNCSE